MLIATNSTNTRVPTATKRINSCVRRPTNPPQTNINKTTNQQTTMWVRVLVLLRFIPAVRLVLNTLGKVGLHHLLTPPRSPSRAHSFKGWLTPLVLFSPSSLCWAPSAR